MIRILRTILKIDSQLGKNASQTAMRTRLIRALHLDASELKEMHQDHLGNVSIRFFEHHPKKVLKIPSKLAASKTLLTPHKMKNRLQFALKYLHWSVDDRIKVMRSDESTFQCISSNDYRTF